MTTLEGNKDAEDEEDDDDDDDDDDCCFFRASLLLALGRMDAFEAEEAAKGGASSQMIE